MSEWPLLLLLLLLLLPLLLIMFGLLLPLMYAAAAAAAAAAQAEDRTLKDFQGDYEYYLTKNESEAVKMEVSHVTMDHELVLTMLRGCFVHMIPLIVSACLSVRLSVCVSWRGRGVKCLLDAVARY